MEWINKILCKIGIHNTGEHMLMSDHSIRRNCKRCGVIQKLQGFNTGNNPKTKWANIGTNVFHTPPKQIK